jgi:RHS repeat-associated protein
VIDEAGTGSIVAVLGRTGRLVERILYADAWGNEPRYLTGPTVESVFDEQNGESRSITITFLEPVSGTPGLWEPQIVGVDSGGATVGFLPATVSHETAREIRMTATLEDWKSVSSTPDFKAFELRIGTELRSAAWESGDGQGASLMLLPAWVTKIHGVRSTSDTPFARQLGASVSNKILYNAPDLYLLGSKTSRSKILTNFKAAPMVDPATKLVYFRARWYDPRTGNFLSADPLGYVDGSNQYAFCGGDPINCTDNTGLSGYSPYAVGASMEQALAEFEAEGGMSGAKAFVTNLFAGSLAGLLSIGAEQGTTMATYGCSDLYTCGMSGSALVGALSEGIFAGVAVGPTATFGQGSRVVFGTARTARTVERSGLTLLRAPPETRNTLRHLRRVEARERILANREAGRAREVICFQECRRGPGEVFEQRTIFGSEGKRAKATDGRGRRLDLVRVEDNLVTEVIEITSPGEALRARKIQQILRGDELVGRQGTYVRLPDGRLIPFASGLRTRVITKP